LDQGFWWLVSGSRLYSPAPRIQNPVNATFTSFALVLPFSGGNSVILSSNL
jgi:hypothetical protein